MLSETCFYQLNVLVLLWISYQVANPQQLTSAKPVEFYIKWDRKTDSNKEIATMFEQEWTLDTIISDLNM